jgi:hypothetical protein
MRAKARSGPEGAAESKRARMTEDDVWQGQKWAGRGKRMGPKAYGAATMDLMRRREVAGLPRVPDHLKPQWEQIVDELDEEISKGMTNAQLLAAAQAEKKALEQPDDSADRKWLREIDEDFPKALPEKWEPPGFRKEGDTEPREQKWTLRVGEVTNLEQQRQHGEPRVQKNIKWLQNKKKAVAAVNGVFGTNSLASARSIKGKMLLEQARRMASLNGKPVSTKTLDNL